MKRHHMNPYNNNSKYNVRNEQQRREDSYWENHPFEAALDEEEELPPSEDMSDGTALRHEKGSLQGEEHCDKDPAAEGVFEATEANEAATCEAKARKEIEEERVRMAAEMDNFKKRLTREHQEQIRYASEKVLGDLLPTLDNLDLALQYGSKHEACKDMLEGVAMTRKLLLDAITKHGLIPIGEEGEPFNPEIHEAVGMEPNAELAPGAVSRVLQRGYRLNDRLLRPAKVMVNQ